MITGAHRFFSPKATPPVKASGAPAVRVPTPAVQTPPPPGGTTPEVAPIKATTGTPAVKAPPKTDIVLKRVYVDKEAANVRLLPDINSARIGVIVKDEALKVIAEKTDRDKQKWYKIKLYEGREGWISETVVSEKMGNGNR